MRRSTTVLVLFTILLAFTIPSCVGPGATGFGLGGATLAEDAAELLVTDRDFDAVYGAAYDEMMSIGVVRWSDGKLGRIEGRVGGASVDVEISGPTRHGTIRCLISAREAYGLTPAGRLARRIANAIDARLH